MLLKLKYLSDDGIHFYECECCDVYKECIVYDGDRTTTKDLEYLYINRELIVENGKILQNKQPKLKIDELEEE